MHFTWILLPGIGLLLGWFFRPRAVLRFLVLLVAGVLVGLGVAIGVSSEMWSWVFGIAAMAALPAAGLVMLGALLGAQLRR